MKPTEEFEYCPMYPIGHGYVRRTFREKVFRMSKICVVLMADPNASAYDLPFHVVTAYPLPDLDEQDLVDYEQDEFARWLARKKEREGRLNKDA